jgi:hypothetical protein
MSEFDRIDWAAGPSLERDGEGLTPRSTECSDSPDRRGDRFNWSWVEVSPETVPLRDRREGDGTDMKNFGIFNLLELDSQNGECLRCGE